ncbi:hypothetical protein D3C75_695730 [compost metagenome]
MSVSILKRRTLDRIKAVDEIQLKAVKVPVPDSLLADAGQILTHFRITGICNPCTKSIIHIQQFILESFPGLTVLADERNSVPQHEFHSQIMNSGDMSLQIGNFIHTHPPVPTIGVAPVLVSGLPPVVHDDRLAAYCCSQSALSFYLFRTKLLMEAVPGRIHRLPGGFRNRGRLTAGKSCPPFAHSCERFIIRMAAGIQPQNNFDMVHWRPGLRKQLHGAMEA